MTWEEVYSQLYFGIQFSVGGNLVHSVTLYYSNSAENINDHPYSATFTVDGHQITIEVSRQNPAGDVYGRFFKCTADAPFWAVYSAELDQVITDYYSSSTYTHNYDLTVDSRISPNEYVHGGNTAEKNLAPALANLWDSTSIADKQTFGGIVYLDIYWCTHLPLRDPNNGNLIINAGPDGILRDD